MEANHNPPPDSSSTDEDVFPAAPPTRSEPGHWPREQREEPASARAAGRVASPSDDGQAALTAHSQTRALRHDGWTPEKKRLFLERFGECGVIVEACDAVGMSAKAAYNLRERDPLFAAGWEAATAIARPPLADEAYSRARNGVVERIYRDGEVIAERHRYDNRLTMSVLRRLDARIDRAEERGEPHLRLVARWDEFLAALGEDRLEDGRAMLEDPPAATLAAEGDENAEDRELRELHLSGDELEGDEDYEDRHLVWEDEEGWWTNYPPPEGFDGEEEGEYGEYDYRRSLSPEEEEAVGAKVADERAEERARAEAQRRAWFGLDDAEAAGRSEPGA
ncbi:MAG TPA: hypothetical protein VHM92_11390 [Allosphingosinicella sp.]|nr:hypothetical protein [Allosphingosinicella sp.]